MIVDDEPHVIKAIRLFLSKAILIWTDLRCEHGSELDSPVGSHRPEILITDIGMNDLKRPT